MPTTNDGQGMMPLKQTGEHVGNSRYGGGINMNDKDYSKIGSHMSGGHLDSLKDIYGEARREQLYNPVVEEASALSMRSPLNEHLSTKQEAKLTSQHKAALHQEDTDPEATAAVDGDMYFKSQAYNEGFNRKDIPNMKNLPIGSDARVDEYNARGWAHDETTFDPPMSVGKSPTGIISKDAIMYDEYPGPDAPATPAAKKKLK